MIKKQYIENLSDIMQGIVNINASANIYTGIQEFDENLNGFLKGNLIIIGGRPANGKTSFALSILKNTHLKNNYRLIYLTLELNNNQIGERLMKSGSFQINAKSKVLMCDTRQISSEDILVYFSKQNSYLKIHIVIIDYIQLLQDYGTESMWRNLKKLASDNNVVVLAFSQLSKTVETRESKIPKIADIYHVENQNNNIDEIYFIQKINKIKFDKKLSLNIIKAFPNCSAIRIKIPW